MTVMIKNVTNSALLIAYCDCNEHDCSEKTALSMDIHPLLSRLAKHKEFLLLGPYTSTKPQSNIDVLMKV